MTARPDDVTLREMSVERAIREQLHIMGRVSTPIGGPSYEYPVELRGDVVVLRDGDCGLAKPTFEISREAWEFYAKQGLWQRVGIWNFVRADDEAADAIAQCYKHPDSMGRELFQLRAELARRASLGDGPRESMQQAQLRRNAHRLAMSVMQSHFYDANREAVDNILSLLDAYGAMQNLPPAPSSVDRASVNDRAPLSPTD